MSRKSRKKTQLKKKRADRARRRALAMVPRKAKPRVPLAIYAAELNANLPKSEVWFQDFWKKNEIEDPDDRYNDPFGPYIPDLINRRFKYVIEIDGTIHLKRRQTKRDKTKDRYFTLKGYEVFRVTAFDNTHLPAIAELIERKRYRLTHPPAIPKRRSALVITRAIDGSTRRRTLCNNPNPDTGSPSTIARPSGRSPTMPGCC